MCCSNLFNSVRRAVLAEGRSPHRLVTYAMRVIVGTVRYSQQRVVTYAMHQLACEPDTPSACCVVWCDVAMLTARLMTPSYKYQCIQFSFLRSSLFMFLHQYPQDAHHKSATCTQWPFRSHCMRCVNLSMGQFFMRSGLSERDLALSVSNCKYHYGAFAIGIL